MFAFIAQTVSRGIRDSFGRNSPLARFCHTGDGKRGRVEGRYAVSRVYDRRPLFHREAETVRQMQLCTRRMEDGPRRVFDMDSFDALSIPFNLR